MKKIYTSGLIFVLAFLFSFSFTSAQGINQIIQPASAPTFDGLIINGTATFDSIKVGKQGVGGVTFFNGTIINITTDEDGNGIPVTFGDDVRIDGEIFRAEVGGDNNLKLSDTLQPTMDSIYSLGTTSKRWKNVWTNTINGYTIAELLAGGVVETDPVWVVAEPNYANLAQNEIISGNWTHRLSASGRLVIDASTTPHTSNSSLLINMEHGSDDLGVVEINSIRGSNNTGEVAGLKILSTSDRSISNGSETNSIDIDLRGSLGDDGEPSYNAINVNNFQNSSAPASALRVGTNYDKIISASSGDIEFDSYNPVINSTSGDITLSTSTSGDVHLYPTGDVQMISGVFQGFKGADISSGANLVVPTGNYVDVVGGSVDINTMATTNIQPGTVVTLQFDANPVVKHTTAGTGAQFFLAGAADFSTTADDTLTVIYDGTYWREIARSVN